MPVRTPVVLLFGVLACGGCGQKKSTDELIGDLKATEEGERVKAVRTLPHRKGDAAQVVPALIEALKATDREIRRDAAIGLGQFGEEAREAIPALQAVQRDRDPRVRWAVCVALSRIDPAHFSAPSPPPAQPGN
jgi:hypothetical protein